MSVDLRWLDYCDLLRTRFLHSTNRHFIARSEVVRPLVLHSRVGGGGFLRRDSNFSVRVQIVEWLRLG